MTFYAEWNALLPLQLKPAASVHNLFPIIIGARILDR